MCSGFCLFYKTYVVEGKNMADAPFCVPAIGWFCINRNLD